MDLVFLYCLSMQGIEYNPDIKYTLVQSLDEDLFCNGFSRKYEDIFIMTEEYARTLIDQMGFKLAIIKDLNSGN